MQKVLTLNYNKVALFAETLYIQVILHQVALGGLMQWDTVRQLVMSITYIWQYRVTLTGNVKHHIEYSHRAIFTDCEKLIMGDNLV